MGQRKQLRNGGLLVVMLVWSHADARQPAGGQYVLPPVEVEQVCPEVVEHLPVPPSERVYLHEGSGLCPNAAGFYDPDLGAIFPGGVIPATAPAGTIYAGIDRDIVEYRCQRMLLSRGMLPAPDFANDLFYNQLDFTEPRLGTAWSPIATLAFLRAPEPEKDLWARFKLLPNFAVAFDTGFVPDGTFDVQKIALGQHPAAGQTMLTGNLDFNSVPVTLLMDNQMRNANLIDFDQVQLFVEANNYIEQDQLRLNHLYGRVWNSERTTVAAGKTYSLFSPEGMLPATLSQDVTLIGTDSLVGNKPVQLRIQRSTPAEGGWGGGVAIEGPFKEDVFISEDVTVTPLTRWPTFSGHLVHLGANKTNLLQFSFLTRTLGLEAEDHAEHFVTAWGLSALGRIATHQEENRVAGLFFGVSGGEGVGQYINGVSLAGAFDGTRLFALDGVGGYAGYQARWITPRKWECGVNLAYGFARMETLDFLDDDTNRKLHQAWANFVILPRKNVAVGLEYQYGHRETLADGRGEDNRFLLVVALTTDTARPAGGSYFREYLPTGAYAEAEGYVDDRLISPASRQRL